MTTSTKFRLAGLFTAVFIFAAVWLLAGDVFYDWLVILSTALFAASVGALVYWRVGNDPAVSSVGLALVLRPTMAVVSLIALTLALLDYRTIAIVFLLLWALALFFYYALTSSTKEHIEAVQSHYNTSSWFEETDLRIGTLRAAAKEESAREALRELRETFRRGGRRSVAAAAQTEGAISEALAAIEGADDENALQYRIDEVKRLLDVRNEIVRNDINKKA